MNREWPRVPLGPLRAALLAGLVGSVPVAFADQGGSIAPCGVVEVTDGRGRPISGAVATLWDRDDPRGELQPSATYQSWETDSRGRICAPELLSQGGFLVIEAPVRSGGRCAGSKRLRWSQGTGASRRLRVVLDVRSVDHSPVQGRLLSPAKVPMAGARIRVEGVRWKADSEQECPISPAIEATSDLAGAFVLPGVPHGVARLHISHTQVAQTVVEVTVPGPVREIILDKGATWSGRVLDPQGEVIEHCAIWSKNMGTGVLSEGACSRTGFVLEPLPPGDTRLEVRLDLGSPLGRRRLVKTIHLATDERRQEDVQWPAGTAIEGQIISRRGGPIPRARILAVPAGRHLRTDGSGSGVLVESDVNGRFVLGHLSPGEWVVEGDMRAAGRTAKQKALAGTTNVLLLASPP